MLLRSQLFWLIVCVVHRYDGEWRNDERHGRGVMIYHCDEDNTFEKYEGEWVSRSYHRSVAYLSHMRGCLYRRRAECTGEVATLTPTQVATTACGESSRP